MRPHMRILFLGFVTLAACVQAKAPVDDSFDDLSGVDVKSDSFSYRMKIAGSLAYGESAPVTYTKSPRYRAVKFAGNAGDQIDAWVRSTDGDAVAWVLDNSFHVLGTNDDADDTTLDAHVSLTLPASPSATHYVVFRDYALTTSHYTVALAGATAMTCQLDSDCAALTVPAGSVSECNGASHTCESVAIPDIKCGGFIMHAHTCPDGYVCHVGPPNPDAPGHCVAQ